MSLVIREVFVIDRRVFLGGLAVAAGCARRAPLTVPAVRAEVDRMFRVTVCLRPFRAAGPRLDVEKVGEKIVVHNYGHGGSGWSLSWGSGAAATEKVVATGAREVAVIGCGALGLTAALQLQRAGKRVTIYAKERPPEVRSARATGSWTPDSRVALADKIGPDFPALWEKMCRASFKIYESYLGMAGTPVEWTERYMLSDGQPGPQQPGGGLEFVKLQDRVPDITPRSKELAPGTHSFPTKYARRNTGLTFNIASLSRVLMSEFFMAGGRMETVEFHEPAELAGLKEKVVVNCTGYGARALWKDESIVPVRGQIAWLLPQAEVNYGVMYKGVYILGRRDGIVVQPAGIGEMEGYNDANETPDRKAAEDGVAVAAELFRKMRRN